MQLLNDSSKKTLKASVAGAAGPINSGIRGEGYLRLSPLGVWQFQFTDKDGKRRNLSCRTGDLAEAQKFRARTLGSLVRRDPRPTPQEYPPGSIAEVLDDYLEGAERKAKYRALGDPDFNPDLALNSVRGSAKRLKMKLGGIMPDDLTTTNLDEYREIREGAEGVIFSTVNVELSYLRAALKKGMRAKPAKVTTIPYFELPSEAGQVREGFLLRNVHYPRLIDALPDSMKAIFVCGFHTGARSGELLKLRWTMVDLEKRLITIRPKTSKNKRGRALSMWGHMHEALTWQRSVQEQECPDCEWVFFWHMNTNAPVRPGTRLGSVNKQFQRAANALGFRAPSGAALVFHDLRRSAVMYASQEADIEQADVMLMSGHRSAQIFSRYNIGSTRQILKVGKKLDSYLAASGGNRGLGLVKDHSLKTA